jgi:hypothetical protein
MSEAVKPSSAGRVVVLTLIAAGAVLGVACCAGPVALVSLLGLTSSDSLSQEPEITDKAPAPQTIVFDDAGEFTLETTLDPSDPDPRAAFQRCRRLRLNARANTVYLVAVRDREDIQVRVEPADGGPAITPADGFGRQGRLVFLADRSQDYTVFAAGSPDEVERPFTLQVRIWPEDEPYPESIKSPPPATVPSVEIVEKLKSAPLTGGAYAMDGRNFWTASQQRTLEHWDTGGRVGGYRLKHPLFALALDRKGRLYAQAGPSGDVPLLLAQRPAGDVLVYDRLAPLGDAGDLPPPSRTILLRGIVTRMIPSADGRWTYFLDVLNGKLGCIDTEAGTVHRVCDQVAAGTLGFCLTPDGKRLYTCSAAGRIDVVETATLQLQRVVRLARGKPHEIVATDRGIVFLLGQELNGDAPHDGNCAMVDLSQPGADRQYPIPVPCTHHGQFLQLAPEQDAVFISGASRVTTCNIPGRPALDRVLCREHLLQETATPSWIQLSRDGQTLLHDSGAILTVRR